MEASRADIEQQMKGRWKYFTLKRGARMQSGRIRTASDSSADQGDIRNYVGQKVVLLWQLL
jgi:hypothetical protein